MFGTLWISEGQRLNPFSFHWTWGRRGRDQKTGKGKRHGRERTVSRGFQINRDRRELCHHWFGVCPSVPVAWDGGLEYGIGHVCGHTPSRDCRTFLYCGCGQGFKETRRALSLGAIALGSPSQDSLPRLHGHIVKREELIREGASSKAGSLEEGMCVSGKEESGIRVSGILDTGN